MNSREKNEKSRSQPAVASYLKEKRSRASRAEKKCEKADHKRNSKIVHKSTIFPFDKQFTLQTKMDDKYFPNAIKLKDKFYKLYGHELTVIPRKCAVIPWGEVGVQQLNKKQTLYLSFKN